jgi:hypothetical protein
MLLFIHIIYFLLTLTGIDLLVQAQTSTSQIIPSFPPPHYQIFSHSPCLLCSRDFQEGLSRREQGANGRDLFGGGMLGKEICEVTSLLPYFP